MKRVCSNHSTTLPTSHKQYASRHINIPHFNLPMKHTKLFLDLYLPYNFPSANWLQCRGVFRFTDNNIWGANSKYILVIRFRSPLEAACENQMSPDEPLWPFFLNLSTLCKEKRFLRTKCTCSVIVPDSFALASLTVSFSIFISSIIAELRPFN